MANRFNTYKQVDYVNMPIDAYQFAAGAAEQENLNSLNQSKQALDAFNSIQAIARPDIETKDEIIKTINEQIQGVAGKNLKGSDVLLQLRKIINNPHYINTLAGVAGNTAQWQSIEKANKKYKDDYGNDINTLRSVDSFSAYNSKGKEAFKPGVFTGLEPGKYIPVEEEVRKAMDKVKADGWTEDKISGGWIHRDGRKELNLNKLLQMANPILRDPTYSSQLENYKYAKLRQFGDPSNPQAAVLNYNQKQVQALDAGIGEATSLLQSLIDKKKTLPAKQKNALDRNIEQAQNALEHLKGEKEKYATDTDGRLFSKDVVDDIALGAVSPYVYSERENTIQGIDQYAHSAQTSALALRNDKVMEGIRQANRKDMVDYKLKAAGMGNEDGTDLLQFPIVGGSNPNQEFKSATTQAFTKQFGDLKVSPFTNDEAWQLEKIKYAKEHINDFGQRARLIDSEERLAEIRKKPKQATDTKILEFANFANQNGFPVNMELLKANGKTPQSVAEFNKLKRIHENFKNGTANGNIATLGVSLTPVMGKEAVSSMILDGANSTGGIVKDQDGKQVKLADVIGVPGTNASAQEKLASEFTATYNPSTNQLQVSRPDGTGVFYVPAPHGLQQLAAQQARLTNPKGTIGKAYGLVSIGHYDNNMNYSRDIFAPVNVGTAQAPVLLNDMDDDMTAKHLQAIFNSKGTFNLKKALPVNDATVWVNTKTGVSAIPYTSYAKDPARYKDTQVVITSRDESGNIDIVTPSDINGEAITQQTMKIASQTALKPYLLKLANTKDKSAIWNALGSND